MTFDECVEIFGGEFRRGVADCCTLACDVFAARHGVDPMREYRGAYSTGGEAEAIILDNGGWLKTWDRLCTQAGMTRCDEWRETALGLARTDHGRALVLPMVGGQWAGKSDDGFFVVNNVRAAWALF